MRSLCGVLYGAYLFSASRLATHAGIISIIHKCSMATFCDILLLMYRPRNHFEYLSCMHVNYPSHAVFILDSMFGDSLVATTFHYEFCSCMVALGREWLQV